MWRATATVTHVAAGQRIDLDWYPVTLNIGGAVRELGFAGNGRVEAPPIAVRW